MDGPFEWSMEESDLQLVEIKLKPGGSVQAETGTMTYMEADIQMETSAAGGVFKGLQRAVSGEGFFITTFTNRGKEERKVAFAAPYPGKIQMVEIGGQHKAFLCQRDTFLCADTNVEIEIAFTKRLAAGLLGGEGFILQKLTGTGLAFLHAGGTVIKKELKSGEKIQVDTGCIVAFSSGVDYDVQFIGGVKNALFGGEGLFLASLQGPGTVYLQSLPISRLAERIRSGFIKHAS